FPREALRRRHRPRCLREGDRGGRADGRGPVHPPSLTMLADRARPGACELARDALVGGGHATAALSGARSLGAKRTRETNTNSEPGPLEAASPETSPLELDRKRPIRPPPARVCAGRLDLVFDLARCIVLVPTFD